MAQAPALTAEQNRLGGARGVLAVTLVVLGALLAPVGAVTVWARQVATDTDTYVNLVAPLAQDPAVPHAGSRIEIADLKERLRKLEAIAAGVDL